MSETSQMTIVEFLEARIAEDESKAQTLLANTQSGYDINEYAERMIAECAAKRGILDEYTGSPSTFQILAHMAFVYKDHPDYQQEEWSV